MVVSIIVWSGTGCGDRRGETDVRNKQGWCSARGHTVASSGVADGVRCEKVPPSDVSSAA